jgi:hypothetical protein
MRGRFLQPVSAASFAAIVLAYPGIAAADIVDLDQFQVIKGGVSIFNDTFDRTVSFAGGTGTNFYSGINFPNTDPANYHVKGTMTENGSEAVLDTSKGLLVGLPEPFLPKTLNVQAFLETDGNLTPATGFYDAALFKLSVPNIVDGTYFVALTNDQATSPGAEVELRIRQLAGGTYLQLAWLTSSPTRSPNWRWPRSAPPIWLSRTWRCASG